jgi:hypothetical protein
MAQDYQEVVYLTDGSIIKGFIIEQVPDDYLKIETASGKIYTIEMYEVEKIIKERQRSRTQTNRRQNIDRYRYNSNNRYNDRYSSRNRSDYYDDEYDYDEYKNYSYFPNRGYKGFIDLGYSYGTESKIGSYSFSGEDRVEFSTSHGILINPYFFVGLGMGFHYYTGYHDGDDYYYYDDDNAVIEIPIFGHIRSHFIDKRVSPFADVKLGYSVYDVTGLYFSPSVGCRFAKGSRSAFWISLGYTVQQIDESYYNTSASSNAVSLKIGWDF